MKDDQDTPSVAKLVEEFDVAFRDMDNLLDEIQAAYPSPEDYAKAKSLLAQLKTNRAEWQREVEG